jgi:NAD(P)-dependent dehydrogenase (short-subunit alcohol dehydrogenase family)
MQKERSGFVLITGVSSGMGNGAAREFVRRGYIVF